MQAEFSEAAFALQPGEMTGIVDTASGLHLIERYVTRIQLNHGGRTLVPLSAADASLSQDCLNDMVGVG